MEWEIFVLWEMCDLQFNDGDDDDDNEDEDDDDDDD